MVTDNQRAVKTTTVAMLIPVLLLTVVPFSHAIPAAFADRQGLFSGPTTLSFGSPSHKEGLLNGFNPGIVSSLQSFHDTNLAPGWDQHYQYKDNTNNYPHSKWHHHSNSEGNPKVSVVNNQNADCTSTSTGTGGAGNGGNGGNGSGGGGGASNGGSSGNSIGGNGGTSSGGGASGASGGSSNGANGGTTGTGGSGGTSGGGNGGSPFGGSGSGGPGSAISNTSCTFNINGI
jgi:hypothetical protein